MAPIVVGLCSITLGVPNDESVLSQYITREKYRHQTEQILRHLEGSEMGEGMRTTNPPRNWKLRFHLSQDNI